jgi:putative lipoic acid-binding regulatory protein
MLSNKDFEGNKFIHPESDKLEFKESFVDKAFYKYLQTICGFLNSGGGNLIFGIKDNLDLVGLNLKNKSIDKMILRIDAIIREREIVGININSNFNSNKESDIDLDIDLDIDSNIENIFESNEFVLLDSSNIKTRQIITSSNKNFIIIEVIPKSNTKYQIRGGMIFYRLGASNYFEKTEKIYKQKDFENACKQIEQKANIENKSNIELFKKALDGKNKQIEELNDKVNKLEETNSVHQTYVQNIITKTTPNVISKQPTNIDSYKSNSTDIQSQNQNQNQNQFNQLIHHDMNKMINIVIKKIFPCLG